MTGEPRSAKAQASMKRPAVPASGARLTQVRTAGAALIFEIDKLALPIIFDLHHKTLCKANRIETGERSGGIGEICSVEVDEK
jgi:hypothetical protein